jgi:hypothetical protein
MNTMLPPARDLPPHRHVQIRTALEQAVAGGLRRGTPPPRRLLVPALAATLAALAVVAAVSWPRSHSTGRIEPAARPPTPSTTVTGPAIPGLSTEDIQAIERGCAAAAVGNGKSPPTPGVTDTVVTLRLRNLIQDRAGRLALLYGERAALDCDLDWPGTGYNAGFSGFTSTDTPRTVTVDVAGNTAGGDVPGNKPMYRGVLGTEVVGGRISTQVAKVTLTQGAETVTANLANGTYLGRIVHASTWQIPDNHPMPVVRAYDAGGNLLATLGG